MKSRIKLIAAALAAAVLIAGLSACEDPAPVKKVTRPSMELLTVKVQPIEFDSNNMPVASATFNAIEPQNDKIPEPVIEADWDDVRFNLSEADSSELWFLVEEQVQTAVLQVTATSGCQVQWGIANSGTRPQDFINTGAPLTFNNNDFIYIRVSKPKEGVLYCNYYRLHARMASPVTLISELRIGGYIDDESGEHMNFRGATYPDWIGPNDSLLGSISITRAEGKTPGSKVWPIRMDDNSTLKFAVADESVTNPSFGDADTLQFADQQILHVKVIAQNTVDEMIYKFRVDVGRIVNIKSLKMEQTPKSYEILTLGIPKSSWDGGIISGSFQTADDDSTYSMNIELEEAEGHYVLATVKKGETAIPTFPANQAANPASIEFENKEELVIRVDSAVLDDGSPVAQQYYKIRVDLLAGVILVQPKSDVYFVTSHTYTTSYPAITDEEDTWYGVILTTAPGTATTDRPVVPLKVEMNKTPEEMAAFTYQWYTANSWYGGYGFDREGRIAGEPGFHNDAYHPTTERSIGGRDNSFGVDEKNNVSFHNGGNQFYRLPIGYPLDKTYVKPATGSYPAEQGTPGETGLYPGIAIPAAQGGTGQTYTPPVDITRRPFIAGYSNQSQYYWVVVTDPINDREVISERCVIVTEWGEKWDLGRPTGEKVTKKHHVVDLNRDLGAPKKNVKPFTYHRELYRIPITFPAGFNIADYSVATAQAVFYLSDGKVWIQNWTNGDIYFYVGDDRIVGYYNLTNNNATLGLSGDSRDPQGASIWQTPTHVVVAPAGEQTPWSKLPLFEDDGVTPANMDPISAQGWNASYIELVELRFEGPRRTP
jgi:hypothetical protein